MGPRAIIDIGRRAIQKLGLISITVIVTTTQANMVVQILVICQNVMGLINEEKV